MDNAFNNLDAHIINDYFNSRAMTTNTKGAYTREIFAFIEFIKKDFSQANVDDCKNYIKYLEKCIIDKKYKLSTVERIYSTLFAVFEFVSKHTKRYHLNGFENWFKTIERPSASRDILMTDIITWVELDKIIEVLKKGAIREYALFSLVFTSALSAEECSNLTWNQFIEEASGKIAIEYSLPCNKRRYVFVTEDTWKLLLEHRKNKFIPDSGYVFYSNKSEKISSVQIRRVFKAICIKAGLEKEYTITQLKDTAVAYALKNNIDRNALVKQLGCSDFRPTRRFDHVISSLENSIGNFLR